MADCKCCTGSSSSSSSSGSTSGTTSGSGSTSGCPGECECSQWELDITDGAAFGSATFNGQCGGSGSILTSNCTAFFGERFLSFIFDCAARKITIFAAAEPSGGSGPENPACSVEINLSVITENPMHLTGTGDLSACCPGWGPNGQVGLTCSDG